MSVHPVVRPSGKLLSAIGIAGAVLLMAFDMHTLLAAPPTAGNLILLVAGASASNTTGSLVEINTTTVGQSAIQTVAIPGTGTDAYRISGSATSTGYVSTSADRSLLTFTGANSTDTSSNVNTLNPRGVYTLTSAGGIVKQTTYNGGSGNQTRAATSLDNITWYIADQGGQYTNNATSASPSGNFRAIRTFGGQVYTSQASSTSTTIQVATVSAVTGGTIAGLPGLTNNANLQDFYLIRSGSSGSTYDVLYVLSATSNTAGTIAKYSLVGGSWTANGTYTTTFGGFGLAAAGNGSGADLFVSTGQGALTANKVMKVSDTAGYNVAINVVTANNVTLYTTGAGTIIKGLDFAPLGAAAVAPSISQNPQSQTIAAGQTATLTVGASGTAPLSYQWYQGMSGDTSTPVGTNSSSFTTPMLAAMTSYWVRVSNAQGSADSATATITVNTAVAPNITTNPVSQAISSGQTATLNVVASGTAPLSYQWYQGASGDTSIPVGTNSSSFTTPALTATTSYWVRVSNAQGTADSTTATISITISTSPIGSGSAVPSSVPAGGTATLSVNVTPGTNPPSTGLSVIGDLSSIGGSNVQTFQGSGNALSFSATVDAATTLGTKTLPITVSDDQGRSTGTSISLTVTAPLANSTVVISEIYSGGGNSNATYTNDFVQLYNRSSATVDLTGWSLQYAPATGTGDWTGRQPLGGTIAPGQYYLIAMASGGAVGAALPPANVAGQINMSNSAGKVALVDNSDLLTGTGGCAISTHIKDLVGYGTTANCWEGTGAAPAPTPTNVTALFRQGGGSIDTNDNKSDFSTGSPNPFTTTPIVPLPPNVFTTYPVTNGFDIPRDATIEVTFTEAVTVDSGWFDITCAVTGQHDDVTEAPDGLNHWITPNVNFMAGETCTVTVFSMKIHDAGNLAPTQDYSWMFTVASGAAPPETPDVHLLMGNPTGAVADINQPANYLMSKPEYAMSYNRDLGRPNWVSWHLTDAWIPVNHPARVDTFRPDPAVPPDWYRVQSFDFSGSGFDRGHMDPNADRESSVPVNQATFLMSNMVAQAPDNNQGPWADFENYLRSVVHGDPNNLNEVYIVSGPVGTGGTGSVGTMNTVAGGHVTVPSSTWKVALVLPDNGSEDDISRVNCSTTTVAVIMPNVQGIRNNPWQTYLTTVSAVETLTGYHFFTNLPQPIQSCIKAGTNGVNPKNGQAISFAPFSGGIGDLVPLQAAASSGLTVTLAVTSGPAEILNGSTLHITGAGLVTVTATQPGDINYNAATPVSQSFQVPLGSQTIVFGGPAPSPTYGDPAFLVSATGGASGNPVTFSATGACSVVSQPGLATVTIVSGGLCTLTASQAGNANYSAAPDAKELIAVARAAATLHVFGATFQYDGQPHGLTGTASGVFGEDLSSLLTLGSTFVNAPGGLATWSFAGNASYLPSNGSAEVTITQAGAPGTFFIPGNLVVAVEGNGVVGAASGPYTDNQAGPLTLFQYAPSGTASATYVSSLVLPQIGSGANLPVSGEYGSSSEGTLQLSGLGHYLTIAGYGITAAAFNANPVSYGSTDPSKPDALAQSGSLTEENYTPIPRVVALIDPYGNVNSSTGLFNVFNTNNPRSVFTQDGLNIYISGQGTGNDLTGGVFYTTLGSNTATAITGATAASNNPPPATIAQDVRDVQLVGGQLYAAIDTKEGTGSNRDFIGTLGPAGNPPTSLMGAPVRLPGFGNNGGTGKFTVTAATTNGINSPGQEINLSPASYFFANATTLYVADGGQPKNDSVTNDSNGITLGNGGLQKWVLSSGTWSLKYTLGLQNGLPLVANTAAAGVTGLYGLAGKVVGGDVLLYVTTFSKNDLDQTFLFGFTDVLAAATNPGTSFTQLAEAPADSNFKGVAFAPSAPSGSVTITSTPSGMAFTSAGAGCAPGNYTTPVTLIWTPGSACTLSAASPQAGDQGVEYQLHQWDDGSTAQTRSVTAPATPTVFSASFDTYYQLTTSAGVGGGVSAGGFVLAGTDAAVVATPTSGYAFTNWTGNVASATSASTTITMNAPQSVTANFHALITPVITWPTPADIVFGTTLGGFQLNASANTAGSFSYTPAAGTVLNAGSGQPLSVTFTPSDPTTYAPVTASVFINVLQAPSSTVVTCAAGPFVYTGSAITPCSAAVSGAGGLSGMLPVMYGSNVNVGTASAGATYGGDANHNSSSGSSTFTISVLHATLSLSNLTQPYDGTPKPVTATASPLLCGVAVTYDGSASAPVLAGTYSVVATVTNANCAGTATGTLTIFVSGVVRHGPSLNSGAVHGSVQVLSPDSFAVNSPTNVSGDLLVPGTPTVKLNGTPTYGRTINSTGSASPSSQTITLNGSVTLNHIVRRTDPIVMPAVSAPPTPAGTRNVVLNSPGQDPGSFSTIRNLTLNSNVGQVAVPPGTYGTFSANTSSGFVLGIPGATTPAVYNFQQLVVNGNARIDVVGPVVITVASGVTLNGTAGVQANPKWLSLKVYSGGVTLNGTVNFYGYVIAPAGPVVINSNSALHGGVTADSLTLNGGLLDVTP